MLSLDPRVILRDLGAGTVVAIVSIAYAFSFAAAMFSGNLAYGFSHGVGMGLLAATVTAIVTASLSTLRFAIAGPDSSSTAPLSVMLIACAAQFPDTLPTQDRIATLLASLTLATLLTGVGLWLLGRFRTAIVVRYIPYPVVAGFLGTTGLLIMLAAIRIITDLPPGFDHLDALAASLAAGPLAAGLLFALVLTIATQRIKHPLTLPALLVLGIVLFHGVLAALPSNLALAGAHGWTFQFPDALPHWTPWRFEVWSAVHWPSLVAVVSEMVAVFLVTALAVLMNSSSLEVAVGQDSDLNRELAGQGLASLASAGLGGFVGTLSASRSMVNRMAGGAGRLSGIVCGLWALAVLFGGSGLVVYVPKFVLGGLLLYLGSHLLWQWTIGARHRFALMDYLTILSIVGVIAYYGYVPGVALGTLAGCIIFAVRYARTPVVNHVLTLAERRSNVERSREASEYLAGAGGKVVVLTLEGFLFFGSTYGLQQQVKALLPHRKTLLLDFRHVPLMDSSAVMGFEKMRQATEKAGVRMVFAGLNTACRAELLKTGFLPNPALEEYPDLDQALEQCEERLLVGAELQSVRVAQFEDWLAVELGSPESARAVARACERVHLEPDVLLCRQGETTDSLLFLDRGRLSVMLQRENGEGLRIRTVSERTLLGEMAFYLGEPRSASVVVERPSVIHILSKEAYQRLGAAHPAAAQALGLMVIRILAVRGKMATKLISAYER